MLLIPELGRWQTGGPLELTAYSQALLGKSQARERDCLKTKPRWTVPEEEHLSLTSDLHTHTCTLIRHTRENVQTVHTLESRAHLAHKL